MDRRLGAPERTALAELAGGHVIAEISSAIVEALDLDHQIDEARRTAGLSDDQEPTPQQLASAAQTLIREAVAPIATSPQFRQGLIDMKKSMEQTIDDISRDEVLDARYAPEQRELMAQRLVRSFKEFIERNKDEITALQVLYNVPYKRRLTHDDIKALADAIQAPPRQWTPDVLWRAYETLEKDKVKGAGAKRLLTDVVSLVRFALAHESELVPYEAKVNERFEAWLLQQDAGGRRFNDEQREWLTAIRDHVAANMEISMDDFEYAPFNSLGGAGRAYRVFGPELAKILSEMNEALVA
jgi:type I restriction enzyme R subunit